MSLVDVMDMGQDFEGTGLTQPIKPEQPAAIPEISENLLLTEEPQPSSNIPPAPHVAPLAQGQGMYEQEQEQPEQQDDPPPHPLAEELTSN